MYVYMYICIYIYVCKYVCMYVCMYVYIYVYIREKGYRILGLMGDGRRNRSTFTISMVELSRRALTTPDALQKPHALSTPN